MGWALTGWFCWAGILDSLLTRFCKDCQLNIHSYFTMYSFGRAVLLAGLEMDTLHFFSISSIFL